MRRRCEIASRATARSSATSWSVELTSNGGVAMVAPRTQEEAGTGSSVTAAATGSAGTGWTLAVAPPQVGQLVPSPRQPYAGEAATPAIAPLPVKAVRPRSNTSAALPASLTLGRIAGIELNIHVSWLLIVVLLTTSLATSYFPAVAPGRAPGVYWLVGLGATLLLFLSVLLHELGHALVARARGLPVSSITLFIFGGVSNLEEEPRSPGEEFVVAVIGPVISLALGGLVLAALALLGRGSDALVRTLLLYLGATNVVLGVFNLLPGFPLDGGRVLRSLLWKVTGSLRTATHWAARVGQGLAFLLIALGVWQFLVGSVLGGLWTGFIGWFLLSASRSTDAQVMVDALLRGVTVAQVMVPAPPAVDATQSLQSLVDTYMWGRGAQTALVEQAGQVVGVITLDNVRGVPREQWPAVSVGQVAVPLDQIPSVSPHDPLSTVLPLLAGHQANQPVVISHGRIVGVLMRDAVMRLVEVRQGLGGDDGGRSMSGDARNESTPPPPDRAVPA